MIAQNGRKAQAVRDSRRIAAPMPAVGAMALHMTEALLPGGGYPFADGHCECLAR